eukprot:TRINITY_DN5539_c0_g2_i2.p1 TRINITY_DN5539_c0_g2~~TRINITY_DN5539_c0_g2_i2.p1  ORF type:complete len:400 (-),score=178.34 TRINITY_DN5539_c0_g2_i2:279-1478(-)
MEAMYDEMVRLGLEEYNTPFLVAGVDCLQAMLALQPQDLEHMGVHSAAERDRVLKIIKDNVVVHAPPTAVVPAPNDTSAAVHLEPQLHHSGALEAEARAVQQRHDQELEALRSDGAAQLAAVRAELVSYKGLSEEKATESAQCVQRLQIELEQEREHGRERLRGELDQFMAQVGHLTALNKDLTAENTKVYAELAASHALNTELLGSGAAEQLEASEALNKSLQAQLADKSAYLEQFQLEMSAQMASCRKAARESEAQSSVSVAALEKERAELLAKQAQLQARVDWAAARAEDQIARQREEHTQAVQEMQDQLLSALADLAPLPDQTQLQPPPERVLCVPLSQLAQLVEAVLSPGAALKEEQQQEQVHEARPAEEAQGSAGYVDSIYNAMELLNPFGID